MAKKNRKAHKEKQRRERIRQEKAARNQPRKATPAPIKTGPSAHRLIRPEEQQRRDEFRAERELRRQQRASTTPLEDPIEQAQEFAYLAYETLDYHEMERLSKASVAADPDCVDGLITRALLKKEYPPKLPVMLKALESARRRCPEAKQPDVDIWNHANGRSLLRALLAAADVETALEHFDEAIALGQEALRLSPSDPLGVRLVLLNLAFGTSNTALVHELLGEHLEIRDPVLAWARVFDRFLISDRRGFFVALGRAVRMEPRFADYLQPEKLPPITTFVSYPRGSNEHVARAVRMFHRLWKMYGHLGEVILAASRNPGSLGNQEELNTYPSPEDLDPFLSRLEATVDDEKALTQLYEALPTIPTSGHMLVWAFVYSPGEKIRAQAHELLVHVAQTKSHADPGESLEPEETELQSAWHRVKGEAGRMIALTFCDLRASDAERLPLVDLCVHFDVRVHPGIVFSSFSDPFPVHCTLSEARAASKTDDPFEIHPFVGVLDAGWHAVDDDAMDLAERMVQIAVDHENPRFAVVLCIAGAVLSATHELDAERAKRFLDRAIEIDPAFARWILEEPSVLRGDGEIEAHAQALAEVPDAPPPANPFQFTAGEACLGAVDPEGQRAVAIEIENDLAQRYVAIVHHSDLDGISECRVTSGSTPIDDEAIFGNMPRVKCSVELAHSVIADGLARLEDRGEPCPVSLVLTLPYLGERISAGRRTFEPDLSASVETADDPHPTEQVEEVMDDPALAHRHVAPLTAPIFFATHLEDGEAVVRQHLDAFLQEVPEDERALLQERLAADLEMHQLSGEEPTPAYIQIIRAYQELVRGIPLDEIPLVRALAIRTLTAACQQLDIPCQLTPVETEAEVDSAQRSAE